MFLCSPCYIYPTSGVIIHHLCQFQQVFHRSNGDCIRLCYFWLLYCLITQQCDKMLIIYIGGELPGQQRNAGTQFLTTDMMLLAVLQQFNKCARIMLIIDPDKVFAPRWAIVLRPQNLQQHPAFAVKCLSSAQY